MKLIKNSETYWEFMRELRNDLHIQKSLLQVVYITPLQQEEYMAIHNNNFYICLEGDDPVGYIGAIAGEIRIVVATNAQGKGIGKFMLKEFTRLHSGCYAKIKEDNTASIHLFESCGYKYSYKQKDVLYYV